MRLQHTLLRNRLATLLPVVAAGVAACSDFDAARIAGGSDDEPVGRVSSAYGSNYEDMFSVASDEYLALVEANVRFLESSGYKSKDISDGAIIGMNGLSIRDLAINLVAGNATNSRALVANPLRGDTFDANNGLAEAAQDPASREFLRYVALCALGPDQRLTIHARTTPVIPPLVPVVRPNDFFTVSPAASLTATAGAAATIAAQTTTSVGHRAGGMVGTVGTGVIVPLDPPLLDAAGVYGLCREWATSGGVSTDCQEAVSACVVLHSNPRNGVQRISLRGEPRGKAIPLAPKVRTGRYAAVKSGALRPMFLPSMRTCSAGAYGDANCGYGLKSHEGFVGACVPGTRVRVGAGTSTTCGRSLGRSTGDSVMVVCNGSSEACSYEAPKPCVPGELCLGPADNVHYNDDRCGTVSPAIEFVCDATGIFSVMLAPYRRDDTSGSAEADAVDAKYEDTPLFAVRRSRVMYPAPEWLVFRDREATAMGNIFDTSRLRVNVTRNATGKLVVTPLAPKAANERYAVYGASYACRDRQLGIEENWRSRFCDLETGYCAAEPLGACNPEIGPRVCERDDGALIPGDGDFAGCSAGGRAWANALTSMVAKETECWRNPELRGCTPH